jgi:cardiolipin synthase
MFRLLARASAVVLSALLLTQCASVPDVSDLAERREQVKISTASGWLTYEQSKKILSRIERRADPQDFLSRHLEVEEAVAGVPLVSGNRIRLFTDGPETYKAMEAAINSAREFIHMQSYIFEDDATGNRFISLLEKKRAEGVAVAVIVDGVGTMSAPAAMFDRIRAANIQLVIFNPVNPLKARTPWSPNERNHRKILVVDGKTGFVGGVNISGVYSSSASGSGSGSSASGGSSGASGSSSGGRRATADASDSGEPKTAKTAPWRDTHVQIDGPVVADIERVFMSAWEGQRGEPLVARDFYPKIAPMGQQVVRILANQPGENEGHSIYLTLISAISSAQKSVHITMAYFVPDPAFLEALREAAQRGVDVSIILPGFTDSAMVFHAGRSHYRELLEAGVKIHERRDVLLHAKTAVVDEVWSTVGSSNMDWRSFAINHEINAVVLGPDFGGQMERLFQQDITRSVPITQEVWDDRGMSDRMKEFFSRFAERWL